MIKPAFHLCLKDGQKRGLVARPGSSIQSCAVCDLKVSFQTSALPAALYTNWPEDIPQFESVFPICELCRERMLASSLGCGEEDGRFTKAVCFVCRNNEHVVTAYEVEITREKYASEREMAFCFALASILEGRLEPGSYADNVRIISVQADGTRELDVTALTDQERILCISECEWFQSQGVIHDLKVTNNRLSFRPDARLLETLLPLSASSIQ